MPTCEPSTLVRRSPLAAASLQAADWQARYHLLMTSEQAQRSTRKRLSAEATEHPWMLLCFAGLSYDAQREQLPASKRPRGSGSIANHLSSLLAVFLPHSAMLRGAAEVKLACSVLGFVARGNPSDGLQQMQGKNDCVVRKSRAQSVPSRSGRAGLVP
jgi:hypothetical protein